ncbi:MAG: biotin--[acetyl-CoA-carboxylase] ligase [Magnetococcales bacterium]|nr:biotin--[acetyl-CoA-carboxylase] ligase [Magnetococcales bacterium]NGZ07038.1 biotin--[acetyl-CoA-carboxylase] ligase [Magnetococcales bacterium]
MSRCASWSEGGDLTRQAMAGRLTGGLFTADRYHHQPEIDSTNRLAMALAQAGAAAGSVVVADAQSRGRGRMGRCWESPAGGNLYVSMVLRPEMPVAHAPRLTLLAGVALHEAVSAYGIRGARLKWPNDLLVDGRKMAGILTEMAAEGERIRHVVVGIGVNVNGCADGFSPEVAARAVTMADILHSPCDRAGVLAALLAAMEEWYVRYVRDGFAPVRAAWKERGLLTGCRACIDQAGATREVWLEDLDVEGFLLARTAGGELVRVVAGDVVMMG